MPQIAHFQVEKWKSSLPWEGGHTLPLLGRYAPSQRLRLPNVLAHYATVCVCVCVCVCVRARVWCSVSRYVCACSREKSQRQIAIIPPPPTPQNGFTPLCREEYFCILGKPIDPCQQKKQCNKAENGRMFFVFIRWLALLAQHGSAIHCGATTALNIGSNKIFPNKENQFFKSILLELFRYIKQIYCFINTRNGFKLWAHGNPRPPLP